MSEISILFGTETGNSENLAFGLQKVLKKKGFASAVHDMGDYDASSMSSEKMVVIITSTFGNGDAPANAEDLLEALRNGMDLTGVRYAVCGLGDSSYTHFAQCGKDFDKALAACKATEALPIHICDEDYDDEYDTFEGALVTYLGQSGAEFATGSAPAEEPAKAGFFSKVKGWFGGSQAPASAPATPATAPATAAPAKPTATLVIKRKLSGRGSTKETMHYELTIPGGSKDYLPGDSIALHVSSNPTEVSKLIETLGLDGGATVTTMGKTLALKDALMMLDIRTLTKDMLALMGKDKSYASSRYLLEALTTETISVTPQQLVDSLRKTQPRLYSIASSSKVHTERVYLLVETLRYQHEGFDRQGLASAWMADDWSLGQNIVVHRVAGNHFRLPETTKDVIMVGPGTGVAPFRAFIEERAHDKAQGRNWLFFGHCNEACDYLYKDELDAWQASGVLSKVSLAWSRDQPEKVYVQHRLVEQGADIFAWLEGGAHFYVCGDKLRMEPDVRSAIAKIASTHGGVDGDAYVKSLEAAGRYHVDAY